MSKQTYLNLDNILPKVPLFSYLYQFRQDLLDLSRSLYTSPFSKSAAPFL